MATNSKGSTFKYIRSIEGLETHLSEFQLFQLHDAGKLCPDSSIKCEAIFCQLVLLKIIVAEEKYEFETRLTDIKMKITTRKNLKNESPNR